MTKTEKHSKTEIAEGHKAGKLFETLSKKLGLSSGSKKSDRSTVSLPQQFSSCSKAGFV